MKKDRFNIRRLATIALFCALAYAVTFVFHFKVMFLTFDAKDAIICLGAMLFGPIEGAVIALVVSLIEFISISDTGFWGLIMNFASSAVFAVIAGTFYRHFRKMWGAVTALLLAVAGEVAAMMVLNLVITPIYMHTSLETVISLIPTLLLPFNLVKAVLNASLVMALYKPISSALKLAGVLPKREGEDVKAFNGRSVIVLASAIAVAVVCVLIYILVLHGSFSFFG